jgi:hypothetical protein
MDTHKSSRQTTPEQVVNAFIMNLAAMDGDTDLSSHDIAVLPQRIGLADKGADFFLGVAAHLPTGCRVRDLLLATCICRHHAVAAVKAVQQMELSSRPQSSKFMDKALDQLTALLSAFDSHEFFQRRTDIPEMNGATFRHWRNLSVVKQITSGVNLDVGKCFSWQHFAEHVGEKVTLAGSAAWGDKVKDLNNGLPAGERPVLWAMLHAARLSELADELSHGRFFAQLDDTHGEHLVAVLTALLRRD